MASNGTMGKIVDFVATTPNKQPNKQTNDTPSKNSHIKNRHLSARRTSAGGRCKCLLDTIEQEQQTDMGCWMKSMAVNHNPTHWWGGMMTPAATWQLMTNYQVIVPWLRLWMTYPKSLLPNMIYGVLMMKRAEIRYAYYHIPWRWRAITIHKKPRHDADAAEVDLSKTNWKRGAMWLYHG